MNATTDLETLGVMAKSQLPFGFSEWKRGDNCCDYSSTNLTKNSSRSRDELELPPYVYVYVTTINVIIFVVGILGNVMVIQVVARMKAMRTQMNFFLMSLSVADLLVLVICQPSALLEFYGKDRWLIGEAMCRLVPFLENASLHSSVLTLLTIGFERYYTICHPLKDQNTCLLTSTGVFVTCIWVLAYILALPFVFLTVLEDAKFQDGSHVKVCRTKMSDTLPRLYIVFIFCIFFIMPMCMLTYMYASIIQKMFTLNSETSPRDYAHTRTIKSRKQVVRMMVAIVILFFVSLLPVRIFGLWIVFTPPESVEELGLEFYQNMLSTTTILGYINSAGNPIIYGLVSSKFRNAFKHSVIKCLPHGDGRSSYTPRSTPRQAADQAVPMCPVENGCKA
ncbi:QRFP-like peptide receptor [Haliotis asinina]|uniref:QRFP-like peptide receptor n=1 Tax=Haliotis asinina TaxID=109174 RepID=UPI0035327A72